MTATAPPTGTVLDGIVADVRAALAKRRATVPVAALEDRAAFHAPTLSLARALRRPDGPAFLAECKRKSPSAGVLRGEYDVAAIARSYKAAAAAAISVLTEPDHFGGSLAHLAAARDAVDLPLLRKDFIVDTYQLTEARAYGADAVLLIAAILDPAQLHDLHDAATALSLGVLVEIHDPRELDGLDLSRLAVVGVNRRDLRTFGIVPERAADIFPSLPPDVVRVAESGLATGADAAALAAAGADAFLVGTAFMREPDPGRALAALRRETAIEMAGMGNAAREAGLR
jgi:indole-3-glycerol phosphate synthase